MSQLRDLLREPTVRADSERTAILGLLDDRIDGRERARSRWRTLKQRLRFKGMGCCGPTWNFRQNTITVREEDEDEDEDEEEEIIINPGQSRVDDGSVSVTDCLTPVNPGMNLGAALAAERYAQPESVTGTPLMRLLAETDGCDGAWLGSDSQCCVCMGREKGAAFIPCGHTFCRVCSRELWLNRGSCPLCNRSIYEVLDLY